MTVLTLILVILLAGVMYKHHKEIKFLKEQAKDMKLDLELEKSKRVQFIRENKVKDGQ